LLLADKRVQPHARSNAALRLAAMNGHVGVLEVLLTHPLIDPSSEEQYAIGIAAQNGHADAVALLLADRRVDAAAAHNWPIRAAAAEGHTAVVKLLLAHPRVDAGAKDDDALASAARNGHGDVVALLLADRHVDPTADTNYALRIACEKGHVAVVAVLLGDARVDPAAANHTAVMHAAANGHEDIVELLLDDPRVNVTSIPGLELQADACAIAGHTRISELLRSEIAMNRLTSQQHQQRRQQWSQPSARWDGLSVSDTKPTATRRASGSSSESTLQSLRRASIAAMQSLSLLDDQPILNLALGPAITGSAAESVIEPFGSTVAVGDQEYMKPA
jgi:ankyrin repeat protein